MGSGAVDIERRECTLWEEKHDSQDITFIPSASRFRALMNTEPSTKVHASLSHEGLTGMKQDLVYPKTFYYFLLFTVCLRATNHIVFNIIT